MTDEMTDQVLVIRSRRVRRTAGISAAAVVVVFTVLALVSDGDGTGVYFRAADQVSMFVFGLLLAAAVLLLARPRVRADADGVNVRNILGEHEFPWSLVREVAFPRDAPWARLELPDDEYVPIMAIRASDGRRAASAIEELRAMYETSRARSEQ